MLKWLKDFLREYVPWTLVDQLFYTQTGRAFLASIAGAAGTFIARALVEAAWLRNYLLIAFAVFLFIAVVLGIWEGLAVLKRSRERQPKSRYIAGDLGFFDIMVNMESGHKASMEVMSRIVRTQNNLTARIKKHAAAMEKINRSGRDVFSRNRKESQRAGRSTDDAVREYEKNIPELAEAFHFYFDGQLAFIERIDMANPERRAGLQKLREVTGNLRNSNAINREAQRAYLKALDGTRGYSQDFDLALGRMTEKVLGSIQVLDDVEIRCHAMLKAIDSKLNFTA